MTSPKSANAPSTKSNPFGSAKLVVKFCVWLTVYNSNLNLHRPVDAAAKEKEVEERLDQEKERIARAAREKEKERSNSSFGAGYSRPTSVTRTESHRSSSAHQAVPTSPSATSPSLPTSQSAPNKFAKDAGVVRPQFSFAAAAAGAKGPAETMDETHSNMDTNPSSNDDDQAVVNGEDLKNYEISVSDSVGEASRKLEEVAL